jgi:hypothetical protein
MVDAGTLATSAQVLLAIGQNASATQILEANTNIWILQAESMMSLEFEYDFVGEYASIEAEFKQALAMAASSKAAILAINQNPNSWNLATSQTKLSVLDDTYKDATKNIGRITS